MKDLPMIEYEKPADKTKSQWELRLQAEIEKHADVTWFAAKQKPKKSNLNPDGTIPWWG